MQDLELLFAEVAVSRSTGLPVCAFEEEAVYVSTAFALLLLKLLFVFRFPRRFVCPSRRAFAAFLLT